MDREIEGHYAIGAEADRLSQGNGVLEHRRTQEILRRHLPPPPAVVVDVGGGPGAHAAWLQADGYRVQLVDPVPLHVEQARAAGIDARPGDARELPFPDRSADVVLLLGPLYHLTDQRDRGLALGEAGRVVRPGGLVAAAAISRFASLLDGFRSRYHDDPAFRPIVEQDLRSGQHRNPTARPEWFTTAFFHHPDELRAEIAWAGLELIELCGVEGPAWLFADWLEAGEGAAERLAVALEAARAVEHEPSLLGLGAHLLALARSPATRP